MPAAIVWGALVANVDMLRLPSTIKVNADVFCATNLGMLP